jgi:Bacterial membrane protein YfhO
MELKARVPPWLLSSGIVTAIFLFPPVFFWRETLGWRTLGDQDAVFWFFPAYYFVAEQIKSGHLPLWTPYLYSGTPLFAEWQAGVLDPINWLYLLGTSSTTLTLSLEMSFAISLLSTYSYTRILGFRRRAGIISAIVYALSGFATGRTLYPGFLHIIALAPFVLYFIEKLNRYGRWRDVAAGALIIAWQIFAAHPQPLVYSSLLACAYALSKLRTAEERAGERESGAAGEEKGSAGSPAPPLSRSPALSSAVRNRLRFLTQFITMFVAGAGLACVQLIPAWEIGRESVRQQWSYELFTLHSLHPVSLLTALFPFFHGSGKTIYHLPYWGTYWHHNEAQIYLGAMATSLAIAGSLLAARERNRIGIFWSAALSIGVILALGKYSGPVARLLYHFPLISHFRSPNRHWMEVTLAVAVLAGYTVDRLLKDEAKLLARNVQITAAALALFCSLVGGFVLWRRDIAERMIRGLPDLHHMEPGFLRAAGPEFYLPVVTAICACVALFVFTRSRQRGRSIALLILLLLIDYNLYASFAPINNSLKLEAVVGQAMPASLSAKQSEQDPIRYHVMLDPSTGEFNPLWFYGHEMATGYDPMLNERYKTFSGIDEAGRSHLRTMLEPEDQTLDLLNVRYIFIPPGSSELNGNPRWREVAERSKAEPYRDFRIFENLDVLPRVWLVNRVKAAYEGDQLKLIRGEITSQGESEFDPRTTVLVDRERAAKLESALKSESDSRAGAARIIERNPTQIIVEAETVVPSVLVLSEIALPGWEAQIDNQAVEIMRVNYDMRGVLLPAGKHRVELFYRPRSLIIGAIISLATALCLFLAVFTHVAERSRNKRR